MAPGLPERVEQYVWNERRLLEKYLEKDPIFAGTLEPYFLSKEAPAMALDMVRAGNLAGVGPMAAVAGAFAEYVGRWLLKFSSQVIVENGGDIFLRCDQPLKVGVFAGESTFSRKLALRIEPSGSYSGICTSSGSVGPSYSQGSADAAVILAPSAILADAVATAAANKVHSQSDFNEAMEFVKKIPGVKGALLILGEKLAAWGEIQLMEV
jgi:uncharacterized protein